MLKWLTLPRLEAMLAQVLSQVEGMKEVVALDATDCAITLNGASMAA
jgi:hypothetical protein